MQPVRTDPRRGVRPAGEHERVGVLDEWSQECPALVGQGRGGVATDVAPPDDLRAGVAELLHHARGLRIVEKDDVARAHHRHQVVDVRPQRLGEEGVLGIAQGTAVTRLPVQHVVHPLGDDEEGRGTRQHPPLGVDADTARVRQQGLQHLGHTTAVSGGVDVPHDAALEELARLRRRGVEQVAAVVGEQRAEPLHVHRGDADLFHEFTVPSFGAVRSPQAGITRRRSGVDDQGDDHGAASERPLRPPTDVAGQHLLELVGVADPFRRGPGRGSSRSPGWHRRRRRPRARIHAPGSRAARRDDPCRRRRWPAP